MKVQTMQSGEINLLSQAGEPPDAAGTPDPDATPGSAQQNGTDSSTEQDADAQRRIADEKKADGIRQRHLRQRERERAGRIAAENRAVTAERELERLRAGGNANPAVGTAKPATNDAGRQDAGHVDVNAIRENERINLQCNAAVETGQKAFTDFNEVVGMVTTNGGILFSGNGAPTDLLKMIASSKNAAALLYLLGKDDDLADRLEGMSLAQQAREIANAEIKLDAPDSPLRKAISKTNTPPPQNNGGRSAGTPSAPSDKDSNEEWLKKRKAQLAATGRR